MRAIVYQRYGSGEVLELRDIDRPVPNEDQVLVRVRAAALNPLDHYMVTGTPYLVRMQWGLSKPRKPRTPGVDLAGTVEAVGAKVTRFRAGDEVFGNGTGALAEYACAAADGVLAPKPANLTFEQAAAVPVAGLTALIGVRDKGRIQPGQRILVIGAAGGVGTFAVQIAKALGAHVTGVCGPTNVDLVCSLGADQVVDYTREDLTRPADRYDVIFDLIGNHGLARIRRRLTPTGILVIGGGPKGNWLGPLPYFLKAATASRLWRRQTAAPFLAEPAVEDLTALAGLLAAGTVTPVIDRTYRLDEAPEALRHQGTGHARGKIVLVV
jgi:NADPH:quinone reductase-like Zn-dependent oxidoreductase